MWRTEVGLREASLVTFPAYEAALVGGVRHRRHRLPAHRGRLRTSAHQSREDPSATDTTTVAVDVDEDPAPPVRSAHQIRLAYQRALRERGVA